MRPEQLRASLQFGFLFLLMPILFLFGLGCFCMAGPSTPPNTSEPTEVALQGMENVQATGGQVIVSQAIAGTQLVASKGEAQALNQALPDSFVGLRIPTAPGSAQPGVLMGSPSAPQVQLSLGRSYLACSHEGRRHEGGHA